MLGVKRQAKNSDGSLPAATLNIDLPWMLPNVVIVPVFNRRDCALHAPHIFTESLEHVFFAIRKPIEEYRTRLLFSSGVERAHGGLALAQDYVLNVKMTMTENAHRRATQITDCVDCFDQLFL